MTEAPGPPDRPAFYALAPGGWRDYWSLLHPPYTVWHLSYVVLGAAIAPHLHIRWLVETVAAFFLAMAGGLAVAAVLMAGAGTVLSLAQRVLSTPVRRLRRRVVEVAGEIRLDDGSVEPIDAVALRAAPERALRLLSLAVPLVAVALLVTRLT